MGETKLTSICFIASIHMSTCFSRGQIWLALQSVRQVTLAFQGPLSFLFCNELEGDNRQTVFCVMNTRSCLERGTLKLAINDRIIS